MMLQQREFEAKQQFRQQMKCKNKVKHEIWRMPFNAKWPLRLCRSARAFSDLETIRNEFLAFRVETACIPVCRHC